MAKAKYPTREELLEVFELRVDSDGREELWRKSYQSKRGLEEEKIVENKANSDNDYCQVRFKGRKAFFHQIIYILVNGNIPDGVTIDHIDCDRISNHSSNLQLKTPREQSQGKVIHRVGGKLVGYTKRGDRFVARIEVKGKQISLGCYDTEQEASNTYFKAVELLSEGKTVEEIQSFSNMKPTKNNPMKGATFDKRKGKWVARPSINRKPVFLGYFTTQEEAYEALCKLKIEIEKEVV